MKNLISKERRDEIRARHAEATPDEWYYDQSDYSIRTESQADYEHVFAAGSYEDLNANEKDIDFVIQAHNADIPNLLDTCDELETEITRLRAMLQEQDVIYTCFYDGAHSSNIIVNTTDIEKCFAEKQELPYMRIAKYVDGKEVERSIPLPQGRKEWVKKVDQPYENSRS